MRRVTLSPAITLAAVLTTTVGHFAPLAAQEFRDPAGRFAARFPGPPSCVLFPANERHSAVYKCETEIRNAGKLVVAYGDFRATEKSIIEICKEWANGVLLGVRIRSLTEIRVGNVAGCEVRLEFAPPGKDMGEREPVIRARYFVTAARRYEVAFIGNRGDEESDFVNAFFASFRLITSDL